MIYHAEALGKSYREITSNLNVDVSTVCRIVNLFATTDDVRPRLYPNLRTFKLTEIDKLIILERAIEKPEIYLREIQAYYND